MKKENIKKLSYSAILMATGIVLPFFTGQIPEIGNMLLPMHLPVIVAGLVCGWKYGAAVGFILPLLRSLMFSRPVLYPSAIAMALELCTLAAVCGSLFALSRHSCIYSLYRALICGILASRAVWGVAMSLLMLGGAEGFTFTAFILGAFVNSALGIFFELILVPLIMVALGKARIIPLSQAIRGGADPHGIMEKIVKLAKEHKRVVVAIDGRCASGKTTLAGRISRHTGASVVHIDDFFLPREARGDMTASHGANIDKDRLLSEVLIPLSRGEPVSYRAYSCRDGSYSDVKLENTRITVIEGSYSMLPEFRKYYDLTIFIYISEDKQQKRLLAREGEERMSNFINLWIPAEERYLSDCLVRESADLVIKA